MAKQNCLGIHYSKSVITAVVLEKHGVGTSMGFTITDEQIYTADELKASVDNTDSAGGISEHTDNTTTNTRRNTNAGTDNTNVINGTEADSTDNLYAGKASGKEQIDIAILAEKIKQRFGDIPPVSMALTADMYQTQVHHSDFNDIRQVHQTLRYDIEEEFSIDAEAVVISYQQIPSDSEGMDIMVHTADRNKLTDLLKQFENAQLDALCVYPDITAWWEFLKAQKELPVGNSAAVLGWSGQTLYLIFVDQQGNLLLQRSYPCRSARQVLDLLSYELPRTLAVLGDNKPEILMYHSHGFKAEQIEKLAESFAMKTQAVKQDNLLYAFAAGAAVCWFTHTPTGIIRPKATAQTDFRSDGLMPATIARARNKALFGLAAAVSVLFLTVILVNYLLTNHYRQLSAQATADMLKAWKQIQPSGRAPRNLANIPHMVKVRRDEIMKKYGNAANRGDNTNSATHAMMLFFKALNKLSYDFDLQFKTLKITDKNIIFTGSVPDVKALEKLHKAFTAPDSGLEITNQGWRKTGSGAKGDPLNRNTFTLPLRVKQAP